MDVSRLGDRIYAHRRQTSEVRDHEVDVHIMGATDNFEDPEEIAGMRRAEVQAYIVKLWRALRFLCAINATCQLYCVEIMGHSQCPEPLQILTTNA